MMRTSKMAFGMATTAMLVSPLALAQPDSSVQTEAGAVQVDILTEGLVHPWGMAFLPDGRLLVTEREGRLRILDSDNTLSAPVEGVPEVFNQGQGGLLDVALDPDFRTTGAFTFPSPSPARAVPPRRWGAGAWRMTESKTSRSSLPSSPRCPARITLAAASSSPSRARYS